MRMFGRNFDRVLLFVGWFGFLVGISTHQAAAQTPPSFPIPVVVEVPAPPTPATADGKTHLVYEMHLTNFRGKEMTLTSVEVFDGKNPAKTLLRLEKQELAAALARPGAGKVEDKRVIGGGLRAVVFLWVTTENTAVPQSLGHRLALTTTDAGGKPQEQSLDVPPINVVKSTPLVISPPLRGASWVAAVGPSNTSGHRRTMIPLDGTVYIAQRFAIDWGKLGEDGKLFKGDPTKNESYFGYGTEVLAVANGTVAAIKDGIPDNVPLKEERAVPITLETIGGNYVVLDLGNGRFAFYAHLQPKSLRVKPGDKVKRGQVLGLLGDSGNSDLPHLHFHISTSTSPLGAEGLPYGFDSFESLGKIESIDGLVEKNESWKPKTGTTPLKHQKEIPLENAVVRFP